MTRTRRVWLRIWIVIICACLGGAVGYLLYTRTSRVYSASAQVYVTGAGGVSGSLVSDEEVASYASIATSTPVLDRVAAKVRDGYTEQKLHSEISATVTSGTTLIGIAADDASAPRAATIANATVAVLSRAVQGLHSGTRLVTVQNASDPPVVISPRRLLYIGLGLAVGLVLGIASAAVVPRRQ